ncbi:MAG: cation transporter [Candidatus Sericytochromatia bacterium]|nr:cation transporter [Candidatus Sericytochromatia bacterium]
MTTKLQIDGMSCDHCVRAVKQALEGVAGVARAEVTVGAADVEGEAAPDALLAALDAEGYAARVA